ncbi:MAG TPA: ABC transporter permease [Solirubrobacteraceae bacterium]|nr:ABC transporter permease [Solirubrobacteraceae bacterium]
MALGRLALAVPMLFVVATATFFLERLVPGDPGSYILGQEAPQAEIHQFDRSLGLDRPVLSQYTTWLGHAIRGDFGLSWTDHSSVTHTLMTALPVTLSLAGLVLVVMVPLGIVLGTAAAVRRGVLDRTLQAIAGFAISIPNFWLGVALVLVLAVKLSVFPATGYVDISSPVQWFRSLALPVLALAIGPAMGLALQVRGAMIDELSKDYVRSLTAAGLRRRSVLFKHALRNGMAPVVTTIGFQILGLLAGTVVIEQLFNLPGLGTTMVMGVTQHNVPVVQGVVLLFAAMVVVINLLTDLAAATLNPKIRTRG